jgi:putative transposase
MACIMFQVRLGRNWERKVLVERGASGMALDWRREMDGRSTDTGRAKAREEIYASAEAVDPEGMGSVGKWRRGSREARNSSHDPVSVEKAPGDRRCGVPQRDATSGGSPDAGIGAGESEAERHGDVALSGTDGIEKKDELGLNGRVSGQRYSREQRERIIREVEKLRVGGMTISGLLKKLGVPRSTFYHGKSQGEVLRRKAPPNSLLPCEEEKIVALKMSEPHLSHRQISGLPRDDDVWVSPSSCYRTLKSVGLVWEWSLREAPWKTARYEPFRPNQIWAEDWTGLVIGGLRHYVITILDLFSRYVEAWGIVRTVTQREVKNLVALALMSEGIEDQAQKPILRTDPGSPNMAADVRVFLKETGVGFSPGRTARPTDNARQERFYRTLKQEEISCKRDYLSLESARGAIARYIDYYNEIRPHQALCGYTPAVVHRAGNKTRLVNEYRRRGRQAQQERLRRKASTDHQQPTPSFS